MKKPVEKKKCFVHLTKKSTNLKGMSFWGSKVTSFLTERYFNRYDKQR